MADRKRKARKLLAIALAYLPAAVFRRVAYATLFGYRFGRDTVIGFGAVIDVEAFRCGVRCRIGSGNRFEGPMRVVLGDDVLIGRANLFSTGAVAADPVKSDRNYARSLVVGDKALIHEHHLFDIYGLVKIGDGTWVAGFRSQFLTHGLSVADRDIVIGAHSYVGSGVLMSPGSGVGDRSIVAMGTVVTKRFEESDQLIGGMPARVLRNRTENDNYSFERTW